MTVYIGTSGWSYEHWEGVLYPHHLASHSRLDYYIQQYKTVEVNSTYYRWPQEAAFTNWRQRLPQGFLMTVKAPRGLTHSKRLYSPEKWLARIGEGVKCLGDRLGILLVQLSPQFACDCARLTYFLEQVPPWLKVAVEFRHPSWHVEEVFSLLEREGAAYCVMSGAHLPCILRATASFVYVRLHGPDTNYLYGGSYSDDDLHWWADRIWEWETSGRSVFVYFNNDGAGNAVRNASRLKTFVENGT
ncbi:DUF72 domain-containing protein [Microcoleus sp. ARI1-B5]|uniref:DUF72 domain-containing protein n=1 Tax=unclassified Microcoleus TaxID=2642155 RepID=UPI002FD64654